MQPVAIPTLYVRNLSEKIKPDGTQHPINIGIYRTEDITLPLILISWRSNRYQHKAAPKQSEIERASIHSI
jgi:hypothetical protein